MKRSLYAIIGFVLCVAMLLPMAACTAGNMVTETLPSTMQGTDTNVTQAPIATYPVTQDTTTQNTATQTDIFTQLPTDFVTQNPTDMQTLPPIVTDTALNTQLPEYTFSDIYTQTAPSLNTDFVTDEITEVPLYTETVTETDVEINTETVPVIETETEPATETVTETLIETEPVTDPITDPITDPVTEAPTQTETETEAETEPPIPGKTTTSELLKDKIYRLNQKSTYFRYVGRVKRITDGLVFDHSASTLEFQGFMSGKVNLTVSSPKGESYFTVYIDGKRSETRFKVSGTNQVITIANLAGKRFHKISIVKQTEVDWSISTLHKLEIKGYLFDAPENKDLYIEFCGDSLTAGYGNIGKPGNEPSGSAPYEDATKTYAYLLAQKLDADCSILARSGVGLAPCWSECFQDRFKQYSFNRSNEAFKFTGARVPDLVVIHLGANDYVYGSSKENFKQRGRDLINYIRNGYKKNMPIIWAYDPGEGRPEWIKEILNEFGGEAKGFYTVALPWSEAGAGGHPSANEHQKHANIVYDLITKKKILK